MASVAAATPVALHALQHVGGVAAFERLDDPVVHLPRRGRDLVEEPAVVGHQQQPAGVARPASLQMRGQPGDALDVEVVGGFVERDDVPVADQQRGQLHPAPLPAATASTICASQAMSDTRPVDDVADPGVAGPLVVGLVADEFPTDGLVRVEGVGLVEDADPHAAAARHPAGIGLDPPGEQAQQAGLAVAVAPDDADAVAVVDPDGDRAEHHLRRVFQMQGLGPEQVRHPADLSWRERSGVQARHRGAPCVP